MASVILLGIDGLGIFFENRSEAFHLREFFNNGSLLNATANVPTDSAENWGSILTGVVPDKHKLKLENLNKQYNNNDYPSLFKIILQNIENYKVSAYVSWEPIITGMIESSLKMDKYAPNINESFISKAWMYISRYWLCNSIYDSFLIKKVLEYIRNNNNDPVFLFIHLVDLDEAGHLYGFNSEQYYKKLKEIDIYVKNIFETAYKYWNDPLIIVTTDHGGIETSHGGNTLKEKNVFIGTNNKLKSKFKTNMECAKIVLDHLNINIPVYFDNEPQG
jgi:predicted AlkP superfamily pyrophosphatase or phosphodiesterase